MDYETRCRRLADQVIAGREVPRDRGVDALRGAANQIAELKAKAECARADARAEVLRDRIGQYQALRLACESFMNEEVVEISRAEVKAVARTFLKAAALVLAVYIAVELAVLWTAR